MTRIVDGWAFTCLRCQERGMPNIHFSPGMAFIDCLRCGNSWTTGIAPQAKTTVKEHLGAKGMKPPFEA